VEVRPFQSFFHAIAGTWWANGLFMLGLLAIGVALIAGVAMRIAAISGVLMLAMMWLAEVPFAQFTSAGEPTGSPNPFADSHYIYAIVLIVLAATYAGTTWGLGATWARLPFVHRKPLGPVTPAPPAGRDQQGHGLLHFSPIYKDQVCWQRGRGGRGPVSLRSDRHELSAVDGEVAAMTAGALIAGMPPP
jgi:uncharacterized membrane protein YphA (DoxX/SURF4 family)